MSWPKVTFRNGEMKKDTKLCSFLTTTEPLINLSYWSKSFQVCPFTWFIYCSHLTYHDSLKQRLTWTLNVLLNFHLKGLNHSLNQFIYLSNEKITPNYFYWFWNQILSNIKEWHWVLSFQSRRKIKKQEYLRNPLISH